MALELRLNVSAFYHRCVHFPHNPEGLETLASLAVQEYEYAEKTSYLLHLDWLALTGQSPSPKTVLDGNRTSMF
jgi:hypothetical protein